MTTAVRDYHLHDIFKVNKSSPYIFAIEITNTLPNINTYDYFYYIFA